MDKKRYNVFALIAGFILLLLAEPDQTVAWPGCDPPCSDCEYCWQGSCVCHCWAACNCPGKSCSGCCTCIGCGCSSDQSKCNHASCLHCVACACESFCDPVYESCCDGACCNTSTQKCCDDKGGTDDGYCCPDGWECCEGNCCNPDTECCDDGECKDCCVSETTGNCEAHNIDCGCDPPGPWMSCTDKRKEWTIGQTRDCWSECGGEPCYKDVVEVNCYAWQACTGAYFSFDSVCDPDVDCFFTLYGICQHCTTTGDARIEKQLDCQCD